MRGQLPHRAVAPLELARALARVEQIRRAPPLSHLALECGELWRAPKKRRRKLGVIVGCARDELGAAVREVERRGDAVAETLSMRGHER